MVMVGHAGNYKCWRQVFAAEEFFPVRGPARGGHVRTGGAARVLVRWGANKSFVKTVSNRMPDRTTRLGWMTELIESVRWILE